MVVFYKAIIWLFNYSLQILVFSTFKFLFPATTLSRAAVLAEKEFSHISPWKDNPFPQIS